MLVAVLFSDLFHHGCRAIFYLHGGGRDVVPRDATHVSIHSSVTVIPAKLFWKHPNIVELICHAGVIKIEQIAFQSCPRLKRVIIPGVKVVEEFAFYFCEALTYAEWDKLERIGAYAFNHCKSLCSNINLQFAKVVDGAAFYSCGALTDAKFGEELESIVAAAFYCCGSLERITVPLKNGIFTADDIFQGCESSERIDLVEGEVLRNTIDALLMDEWRNDMNEQVFSINAILPNAYPGYYDDEVHVGEEGDIAQVIREWIRGVLSKIIHYKAEHRSLLHEAAFTLQLALPNDIVTNSVIPFLELPLHTFEGEE